MDVCSGTSILMPSAAPPAAYFDSLPRWVRKHVALGAELLDMQARLFAAVRLPTSPRNDATCLLRHAEM